MIQFYHPKSNPVSIKKSRYRITLALFILSIATVIPPTHAASFNCAKATAPVEITICAHPLLNQADERLGAVYSRLRISLSSSAAAQLKQEQQQWIKNQDRQCDADAACLLSMTNQRRQALEVELAAGSDDYGTGEGQSSYPPTPLSSSSLVSSVELRLDRHGGGYELPVRINSVITLNFMVDSGASEVTIPADVALTLLRTGTIQHTDFLPGKTFVLADGSELQSMRFVIRELSVDGCRVFNVPAAIAPVTGSLLLGQSFLKRFKRWTLDNERHLLIIETVDASCQTALTEDRPVTSGAIGGGNRVLVPESVVILAGEFMMGSPASDKARGRNERQHRVVITKAFAIGKHEVTFEEYDRFCEATGRAKPADEGWGRGQRPVINVSWHDAMAYAAWLSVQTGHRYRLPTEAEWEYAARAGTSTAYWWGNTVGQNNANCKGCGNRGALGMRTVPVGSFPANPFGLHDTAGNVSEWTCSAYDEQYGGQESVCSTDLHAESLRAVRGSAWSYSPRGVRAAYRTKTPPDWRDTTLGFRLVREL